MQTFYFYTVLYIKKNFTSIKKKQPSRDTRSCSYIHHILCVFPYFELQKILFETGSKSESILTDFCVKMPN